MFTKNAVPACIPWTAIQIAMCTCDPEATATAEHIAHILLRLPATKICSLRTRASQRYVLLWQWSHARTYGYHDCDPWKAHGRCSVVEDLPVYEQRLPCQDSLIDRRRCGDLPVGGSNYIPKGRATGSSQSGVRFVPCRSLVKLSRLPPAGGGGGGGGCQAQQWLT